jgi:hypothetical protein
MLYGRFCVGWLGAVAGGKGTGWTRLWEEWLAHLPCFVLSVGKGFGWEDRPQI